MKCQRGRHTCPKVCTGRREAGAGGAPAWNGHSELGWPALEARLGTFSLVLGPQACLSLPSGQLRTLPQGPRSPGLVYTDHG